MKYLGRVVLILLALHSIASDNEKLIKMYKRRFTNKRASVRQALVEVGRG